MVNKAILVGYVGNDPQTTHFDNGGSISKIPLATSESWKDKQTGEKKTATEWHNCVFSGKQAELCEKYIKKGDKLYLEGKITTRKWQDTNGQDRYTTEIRVLQMQFLTSKSERSNTAPQQQQAASPQATPDPIAIDDNDDLPF